MTRYVGIALPTQYTCVRPPEQWAVLARKWVCHVCVYRTEQNKTEPDSVCTRVRECPFTSALLCIEQVLRVISQIQEQAARFFE